MRGLVSKRAVLRFWSHCYFLPSIALALLGSHGAIVLDDCDCYEAVRAPTKITALSRKEHDFSVAVDICRVRALHVSYHSLFAASE